MHKHDTLEPALDKSTTMHTKEEARNARIALLTTPSHKAAIEAAAEEAGQTLTAYVMRRALAGGMVRP